MGFEVVRHVVATESHEIVALETEMVQGVVGDVVDHIPKQKTSKDAIDIIWQLKQTAHHPQEQPIEDRSKGDADHWRHHQPTLLPRLGVMDPVH